MKNRVLGAFSAVILLAGIIVVSGCNEETPATTPQDIDIVDTTKAVLFKEVLPISAIKHRRSILQKGLYYLLRAIREVEYSKYP